VIPAGRTPDVEAERRTEERLAILGALRAEVTMRQSMDIVEISPTGLQVVTAFPFQLDSLHEIRLTLGLRTIVVRGRITHCHIADLDQESVRYRSGIECTELPEQIRTAIVEFIDALKGERSGGEPGGGTATSD
jgi:hypothetical protein